MTNDAASAAGLLPEWLSSLFDQLWDFFWCWPLNAVFVVGTLLVAVALLCFAIRYCGRRYRRHWYDLEPPACAADVRRTATEDPLTRRRRRRPPWRIVVRDAVVLLLTLTGLIALVVYFATAQTPGGAVAESAALVLALTAAVLSLGAFFYQTRARVLSENRQDWIHRVRAILVRLNAEVSLKDSLEEGAKSRSGRQIERDLVSLELHLNPGELDHRVLLALLRRALGRERSVDGLALSELHAPMPSDLTNLNLWITRLATGILKREWEQVKHVR